MTAEIPPSLVLALVERLYARNYATRTDPNKGPDLTATPGRKRSSDEVRDACASSHGLFVPDYIGGVPIKLGAIVQPGSRCARVWASTYLEWRRSDGTTLRGDAALAQAIADLYASLCTECRHPEESHRGHDPAGGGFCLDGCGCRRFVYPAAVPARS